MARTVGATRSVIAFGSYKVFQFVRSGIVFRKGIDRVILVVLIHFANRIRQVTQPDFVIDDSK